MTITSKIRVENGDVLASLKRFFQSLLELEEIEAILISQHLPASAVSRQTVPYR